MAKLSTYTDHQSLKVAPQIKRLAGTDSIVNVKHYGAIGDGLTHPLSTAYGTLAAAQAVYSFATALTQEIDYCACKAASNAALGADLEITQAYRAPSAVSDNSHVIDTTQNWPVNSLAGRVLFRRFNSNLFVESQIILSNTATQLTLAGPLPSADNLEPSSQQYAIGYGEHGAQLATLNKPIYIPPGTYWFGNNTWTIRNAVGIHIYGAARTASILRGNSRVLVFDGLWYSRIELMSIMAATAAAVTAFDIDGNVPGHAYDTRSTQANTFKDLLVDGGGSEYACTLNRVGQSGAQGDQCTFENCHFSNTSVACYSQWGFNTLNTLFLGGNFQNYTKHGALTVAGSFSFYNTAFQSVAGYKQIVNDGWDILCGQSGAFEAMTFQGIRTESLRFLRCDSGSIAAVRDCVGRNALPAWSAGTQYGPATTQGEAIAESAGGILRMFRAITPGTSHGTTEPVWPTDGTSTVNDGTIVWQEVQFNSIQIFNGMIDFETVEMTLGRFEVPQKHRHVEVNATYVGNYRDELILADTSGGARTIDLPRSDATHKGKVVTVVKSGADANAVTISPGNIGFADGAATVVIAGGSRGWRTFADMGGGNVVRRWFLIGSG